MNTLMYYCRCIKVVLNDTKLVAAEALNAIVRITERADLDVRETTRNKMDSLIDVRWMGDRTRLLLVCGTFCYLFGVSRRVYRAL